MASNSQWVNPYAEEAETEEISGEVAEFVNPYEAEAEPAPEIASSTDEFDPLAPAYDIPVPTTPEEEGTEWADYGKMTMAGGAQLVKGAGWLLDTLGADDVGGFLEELGRSSAAYWLEGAEGELGSEGLSKAARAELAKEFIKETDEGYEMGDASWRTVGLMASNSILGTMAGMGIGGLATKGIQSAGGLFGRNALVQAANAGNKAAISKLAKLVAVEGAIGYGAGEALVATGSAGSETRDAIMALPKETIVAHPEYQRLSDTFPNDIDEEEKYNNIHNILADAGARKAAMGTMATTFALSSPMGAIIGRYTQGLPLASTRPRAIATGGIGEMSQEFFQSGAEAISRNVAIQDYGDIDQPLFKGVLNEAIGGAAAGLPMGAAFGVASPLEQPTSKPSKKTISAEELGDIPTDKPDIPESLYEGGVDFESDLGGLKEPSEKQPFQESEAGVDFEAPEQAGGLGLVEPGAEQAETEQYENAIDYTVDLLGDSKLTAETPQDADKRVAQDGRIAEQEEKLKGVKLPEGFDDNRLKRLEFRDRAKLSLDEMIEGGDLGLIPDPNFVAGESDKPGEAPMIRASSQNPDWVQNILADTGMTVDQVKKSVNKALKGGTLGIRQGAAVQGVLDQISDQRTGDEFGNLDYAKQQLEKARNIRDQYTQGVFAEPTDDWLYEELDYHEESDAAGRIIYELLNETRTYGEEAENQAMQIAERSMPDEMLIGQLSQLIREYNGYDEQEYQQVAGEQVASIDSTQALPGQPQEGIVPDQAQPGAGELGPTPTGELGGLTEPQQVDPAIDEGFMPEPEIDEITELQDVDSIVEQALAEEEEFVKPDIKGVPAAALKGEKESEENTLSDLWNQYDDTGEISTHLDLVNEIEEFVADSEIDETTRVLDKAISVYRKEQTYNDELGGRGDMDSAEEAFNDVVISTVNKKETKGIPAAALKEKRKTKTEGKRERRDNDKARKLYSKMSREELLTALLTHELTGIKGRRSFVVEVEDADNVISIDADSLKWFNDTMSPESGDKLLQAIADALVDEIGDAAYHISGDEFYGLDTGQGIEELEAGVKDAQSRLKNTKIDITKPDGTTITKTGIEFTYGIGKTKDEADYALKQEKISREKQGLRAGREQEPAGVVIEPAEGKPDKKREGTEEEKLKYVADYYVTSGARELAHKVKAGDSAAIKEMAKKMADIIPAGTAIIPMPSRTGKATDVLKLANEIAKINGNAVADILKGENRRSWYELKKEKSQVVDFGFFIKGAVPEKSIIIDTVYDTGETMRQAKALLPNAKTAVYAISKTAKSEKLKGVPEAALKKSDLDKAAHEAATSPKNGLPEPTEAQKEAGNYKKGSINILGLEISIENPKGSKRSPKWPALKNHYGYIKKTEGADGDHIDVFLTDDAANENNDIYIIDQTNKNKTFDEHKLIIGASNLKEAKKTYLANYSPGWTGLGEITGMPLNEFKEWLKGDTTKAIKYKEPKKKAPEKTETKKEKTIPEAAKKTEPTKAVAQDVVKKETKPKSTPLNEIKVRIQAQVEGSNELVEITRPADIELSELDERLDDLKKFRDCLVG